MEMKRMVAAGIAVAALAMSTPAFAGELDASTGGAYAWTSGNVRHYANIKDTDKDGHPVKAQYSYPYFSETVHTLWEKRGYGYSTKSARHESEIWRIKACEYINNWPDDCSGWDSD
ncbi:hypothetical protein LXH13_13345 [Streptomyces spinosirectus]|uniref:hypothetical protein n=1 Tax=Streptomyces TaxID=1883 RepID=UPI000FFEE395|nr:MULTISPECIES: hypothetical protein [Streptomyces]MBY8340839.1 hypothetical protein [Streptomyces plumbidurans]UIR17963.1 hypothetical protein LXH13_13345 [Streptomyces spinosirectus]